MKNKKNEKFSTQKIITEYGEKIIEYIKENKNLKTQLKDLQITLSINKDMLNNQIKNLSLNPESKNQMSEIITTLQNENLQITNRNTKLYNDNIVLEKKLYKTQQELNEKIKAYNLQIKELNDKIFILSNKLIEKENDIKNYKNELVKIYKDDFNSEIYVSTSPTKFNLELNNELCEARQIIIKYSHLLNDAQKLINQLNVKIISLKEMIQNIKDGKRIKKNLENIENFGYILTEDSNESEDNLKNFYIEDDNGNLTEEFDIDDDKNFGCDSPLIQIPNKIKHTRYLTTTSSNDIQVPKLDLSFIIKKYKPIEKKEDFEKKDIHYHSIHNYVDDRDYIDKLKFKLKFYRNILKKYKQKFKQQKKIISMLKKHCLKNYNVNLNTNCSTSDSKLKNNSVSNETVNNNNLNGCSMDNNINFSMDSECEENELNIVINKVNKEAINMLGESNSFYNK